MNSWHSRSTDRLFEELDARSGGLTEHQAAQRLEKYGPNALAAPPRQGLLSRVLTQMGDPMVLVLLGVQELSLHAYWDNAVGLLTQFFYLPLLRLGAIVAMWTGQVFWFYFGAFLLLVLSSWLGCRAKDPVKK